jgi:hypothetical protein
MKNAQLKERLSEIIEALQITGVSSQKDSLRLNHLTETVRTKELVLLQEIKALRALLKFKKSKNIHVYFGRSGFHEEEVGN